MATKQKKINPIRNHIIKNQGRLDRCKDKNNWQLFWQGEPRRMPEKLTRLNRSSCRLILRTGAIGEAGRRKRGNENIPPALGPVNISPWFLSSPKDMSLPTTFSIFRSNKTGCRAFFKWITPSSWTSGIIPFKFRPNFILAIHKSNLVTASTDFRSTFELIQTCSVKSLQTRDSSASNSRSSRRRLFVLSTFYLF